jgi:LmbE family N-acetylglucosaminyl deacetylase
MKKIMIASLLIIPLLSIMAIFSIISVSDGGDTNAALNATTPADTKVAVILPHPDDETIGLGGTIQMLMENGTQVHCELMTSGNAISGELLTVNNYYNVNIPANSAATYKKKLIREDSFRRVMEIYGCDYNIEGYEDGSLNSDIVFTTMENLYLKEGYTVFYTVTGDGNGDHMACQKAMIRMKEKYPDLKYRQFPIYWYHYYRRAIYPITGNYKDLNVAKYSSKKKQACQVYYNINTIHPDFYPYSSGKYSVSPERIYYIN